jgi:eukaryotic-like serine/threonine-protein kinase
VADVGRVLGGRYQLVELIGQGGMATIYRARDSQLNRDVAVKVLRAEYGVDGAFVARFRREALAAAQLNHPNVVGVFDYATDIVGPYIVMELVTGGDLAAVLRQRGPLPPTASARIAQQIADALDAAHARGIVHRDIKPSNVLLTSGGRVKVADFGIAQAFSDAQLTVPGMTMGSVHYFSPEQARGDVVTTASDVYSTGLVLFEMLTGQRAFSGDSAAAVAMARLTGHVPSPLMVRADAPTPLDAIVRWALQPDPRARPSAAELSAALGRYLADPHGTSGHHAVQPPPPPMPASLYAPQHPESDPPDSNRWSWIAALFGLFVLVAAGVLLFLIISSGAGRPDGSPTTPPVRTPTPGPTRTPSPTRTPAPTRFEAPSFVGMTLTDARTLAAENRLKVRTTALVTGEAPPDTVLSQNPEAGVPILPGSTVELVVAALATTVPVPELRGYTESDAISALLDAGLEPGGQYRVFNPSVPQGLVVRTDPRAGIEVARGTTVDYYLSRGPRPTPSPTPPTPNPSATRTPKPTRTPRPSPTPTATPHGSVTPAPVLVGDYQCLDLATAVSQIEASGLVVGSIFPDAPPRDDGWQVKEQQPAAGEGVVLGTVVDLLVVDPSSPCP